MADNVVLPATSGTVAADEVTDTVLGTVKAQYVKLMFGTADSTAKTDLNTSGPGFLRTSDEPRQLFYDPFDGTSLDIVNRWTGTLGSGATLQPTQTSGQLVIDAGSTAEAWASLASKFSFTPTIPGWLGMSFALNLTDGAALVASGYRFWGAAILPNTPTIAAPITDGIGFEVTGGKMYAVVYASGVRTAIQDMSAATGNSTAPTDALNHRYIIYMRTDRTFFYVDSLTTPAATTSFQSPSVQTMPLRFVAISGGETTQIMSPGSAVWDTGKNNTQISDGSFPWRKATVSAGGALKVDNSAVIQPVSISTGDYASARAQELALLTSQANLTSSLLQNERYAAGRYGVEIR